MLAKVYNFKSVGEEPSFQRQRAAEQARRPPIGIKTPLELANGDEGFIKMHSNIEDVISDNLKNLILTNHGERFFDYNFGANLKELTFELGSEETDEEAIRRIQYACARYMPYIVLNTFEPIRLGVVDDSVTRIGIKISYTVPSTNSREKIVEVILYTVG